jgi:hypothetical protein
MLLFRKAHVHKEVSAQKARRNDAELPTNKKQTGQ